MKWTIHQLHQLRDKGLKIDDMVDVHDLVSVESAIRKIDLVHVTGRADISSTKVTFHLTIDGKMVLPCSRTLVDVPFDFHIETMETFVLNPIAYDEEEDIHTPEGDIVDLLPIVKECILLEIPLQIFSEAESPSGGAPQSGKDWQVITEEDKQNQIDPRLANLAKFFENQDE